MIHERTKLNRPGFKVRSTAYNGREGRPKRKSCEKKNREDCAKDGKVLRGVLGSFGAPQVIDYAISAFAKGLL